MKNRKQWTFTAIISTSLLLTGVFFFSGCSTTTSTSTSSAQVDISQAEWSINSTPNYNNFKALGFVSVEATLTGKKDSGGKITWSGTDITYAGLIEKAKVLNADAVINIVIDTVDTEETVTTGNTVSKVFLRKRIATGLAIKYLEWRSSDAK